MSNEAESLTELEGSGSDLEEENVKKYPKRERRQVNLKNKYNFLNFKKSKSIARLTLPCSKCGRNFTKSKTSPNELCYFCSKVKKPKKQIKPGERVLTYKKFYCPSCNKYIGKRNYYKLPNDKPKRSFPEKWCNECQDKKLFQVTKLICDLCGQFFYSKKSLEKHFEAHRQNVSCDACKKIVANVKVLQAHLRSHFEEYQCHECGEKFTCKNKFKLHSKRHDPVLMEKIRKKEEGVFNCKFCPAVFYRIQTFKEHITRIHRDSNNEKKFKCEDCSESFFNREEHRIHKFKHFTGKIHYCDFPGCDKFFKNGKNLTIHKQMHSKPSLECLNCGRLYNRTSTLRIHMKLGRCKKPRKIQSQEEIERMAEVAKTQFEALKQELESEKVEAEETETEEEIKQEITEDDNVVIIKVEPIEAYEDYDLGDIFSEDNGIDRKCVLCKAVKVENFGVYDNFTCDSCELPSLEVVLTRIEPAMYQNKSNENPFVETMVETKPKYTKQQKFVVYVDGYEKVLYTRESPSSLKRDKKREYERNYLQRRLSNPESCEEFRKRRAEISRRHREKKKEEQLTSDPSGNVATNEEDTEEKNFFCHFCGSHFKKSRDLKAHLQIHNKPEECRICGKMVRNLKNHERNHIKPPKTAKAACHICGKVQIKGHLKVHIKMVHEKAFVGVIWKCEICFMEFTRREDFRKHDILNHFNGRIRTCEICNNIFKTGKALTSHKKNHFPKNYQCDICGSVIATRGNIAKHMNHIHMRRSKT